MAMQQIVQPFTQHSYQKFGKPIFEHVARRYGTDIPSSSFFIFCVRLSPALHSYKRTGHGITRRPYRSKTLTHFGADGWRIQGTFISPYQLRSLGIGTQGIMLSTIPVCMNIYLVKPFLSGVRREVTQRVQNKSDSMLWRAVMMFHGNSQKRAGILRQWQLFAMC